MSTSPRFRIALILGACVLAGAAVFALKPGSRPAVIRPGSTAFSAQEDGIRTLTYRTTALALTARRAGAGFAVTVVGSDGRPEQRCAVSGDLGGLLPRLVEIAAKRELTLEQAATEFPVQLGTLVLKDEIANEPIAPFTVRATKDGSAVALVYQGTAIEAAIAPETFARLGSGCAALANRPAAGR